MALVRLVVFGGIGLCILYFLAAWFARSTRRERLEKEWDAANPDGDPETRRIEVEEGVEAFKESLLYRSLILIFIVPAVLIFIAYYMTN